MSGITRLPAGSQGAREPCAHAVNAVCSGKTQRALMCYATCYARFPFPGLALAALAAPVGLVGYKPKPCKVSCPAPTSLVDPPR